MVQNKINRSDLFPDRQNLTKTRYSIIIEKMDLQGPAKDKRIHYFYVVDGIVMRFRPLLR